MSHILVVDDNRMDRRKLSRYLEQQGHTVASAENGQQALEMIGAQRYDLVLLDIVMPEMDGYQVLEQMKRDGTLWDTPVIVISVLDETVDKVKGLEIGAVDYITKPFQAEEVLARTSNHLSLRSLRKKLQEQIVERDKLIAELDAYAHTVAHDLKSPLGTLIGYATLLQDTWNTVPPEEIRVALQHILRTGHKMCAIIDELLLIASTRQQEVETNPLNTGDIVADVQQRLAYMIEKCRAEIIVPADWPTVLGHAPWVEEVWVNYISNAIGYGGQPPRVELGATAQADGLVRFWVRDNGRGLTPEEQAQLFTPFTQLSQARARGHGLGLSIVQRIVEKLGGQVGVESAVGQGSVFYFTLPGAGKRGPEA